MVVKVNVSEIQRLMIANGILTDKALAAKMHSHPNTLGIIRRNGTTSGRTAYLLCCALNCKPEDIIVKE